MFGAGNAFLFVARILRQTQQLRTGSIANRKLTDFWGNCHEISRRHCPPCPVGIRPRFGSGRPAFIRVGGDLRLERWDGQLEPGGGLDRMRGGFCASNVRK